MHKYPQMGMTTSQLGSLNENLKNYMSLPPQTQIKVRREVIQEVKYQRDEFRQKLKLSSAELKKLNLILGATGAGKSTLFNFLNELPLIIREGVDKNGQKNQKMRLDIDVQNLPPGTIFAPIGHGFVSETTIPNFAKSKFSDVTYVDCAGQFDSRDILQSIINSYFKYELAVEAKQVKITIAINYNDLGTNRATIFRQILKQVGNFIGLWDEFQKNKSISLVINGADPTVENVKEQVLQTIREISQDVKDLGPFKQILADITQRSAVAIFLAPQKQYNPQTKKFSIPDGQRYNPQAAVCSPALISKTLQETKLMKSQPGLFVHNLQNHAQYIVNVLCQGIIKEIKTQVMSVIVISLFSEFQSSNKMPIKKITAEELTAQKSKILERISELSNVQEIKEIINIFRVKDQNLYKYAALNQDLNQFLKISNIPNIKEKIAEVSKDIIIFLREKVMNIDKETINFMNQACQQSVLANKRLQEELASKREQMQFKILMVEADIEMQKIRLEQQEKADKRKDKMQYKKDKEKMKHQEKIRLAQLQVRKDELSLKKQQIKYNHEKVIEENNPLNKFVGLVQKGAVAIIDVLAKKI